MNYFKYPHFNLFFKLKLGTPSAPYPATPRPGRQGTGHPSPTQPNDGHPCPKGSQNHVINFFQRKKPLSIVKSGLG